MFTMRRGLALLLLSGLTHIAAVAAPRAVPQPLPGHPGTHFRSW